LPATRSPGRAARPGTSSPSRTPRSASRTRGRPAWRAEPRRCPSGWPATVLCSFSPRSYDQSPGPAGALVCRGPISR
jgi:hypothetical protein